MKKSLLVLSALISGLGASAQITVTTADVVVPPKTVYQNNDTLPSGSLSVGGSGTNQTWNMSMLNAHTMDTLAFSPAAWIPSSTFPSSNIVMKQGWQNNYAYLTSNAAGLTTEGSIGALDLGFGPMNVKQINTPSEILMSFPENYSNSITNNFVTVTPAFFFGIDPGIGFTIDSVRQHSGIKKTILVDAWGTLTTPLATFGTNPVLRSEETIVRHDTIDAYVFGAWTDEVFTMADSTTGYTWWANSFGFPLVSIKLDSMSNIKQVQWLDAIPLTGVAENAASAYVNVYPNPAQNEITFAVEATKVSAVEVYDIAGRLITSYPIAGAPIVKINTSEFANGVYSFALIGNEKAILNRGKFTVAK